MGVVVVDYGMGNLASLFNALKSLGKTPKISSNPHDLSKASHVILPGQGAFKKGMEVLSAAGWVDSLRAYCLEEKKPLLGICLGMQLLADKSYEMEETQGLKILPGEVVKLQVAKCLKLPHVGWNTVSYVKPQRWFEDMTNDLDFYFVHSYCYNTSDEYQLARTEYGQVFPSIIGKDNILGVQFHPEKSARPGRELLKNFLSAELC